MSARQKVIHIGLADPPRTADFTMTEGQLRAAVQSGADKAEALGFDVTLNYIRIADIENNVSKVLDDLRKQVRQMQPVGVIIGGGLKMNPQFTPFFEQLVHLTSVEIPHSKLGFQSKPDDIDDVCQRCFQSTTKSPAKTIVHIGLGDAPPGFNMTDEQIRREVQSGADKAQMQGFDVSLTFIMSSELQSDLPRVLDLIRGKLRRLQPFGVIVGGGVKINAALTSFFEQVVDISRMESPNSRLGFQSKPDDIWEVCQRFSE